MEEKPEILVGCKLDNSQHHMYLPKVTVVLSYINRNFSPLYTGQSSLGVLWLLLGIWF